MELHVIDQVNISSVSSDVLKPGDKINVSKSLGEELLRKLPHAVSEKPAKAKPAPVSAKAVIDGVAAELDLARDEAETKKAAILQSVTDAQTEADEKILAIRATVADAQAAADEKIAGINATLATAQVDAEKQIEAINAGVAGARQHADGEHRAIAERLEATKTEEPRKTEGEEDTGQKQETAPANKMQRVPNNKAANS